MQLFLLLTLKISLLYWQIMSFCHNYFKYLKFLTQHLSEISKSDYLYKIDIFFFKIPYLNQVISSPWCGITSLLLTDDSITGKKAYFTKGLCLTGPERFCVIQKMIATFFVRVLGAGDKTGWQGYHNEFASCPSLIEMDTQVFSF